MPRPTPSCIIWHEPTPYFDTLEQAHDYVRTHNDTPVSNCWPAPASGRKLLVCHDFKGGYTENGSERGYSLEHWESVDIFVYFAHHRVSLPPAQWIRAAHENQTPILGTLIFEWQESLNELSILLGRERRFYVSTRTADMLVDLALQRGIQGFLINIEAPLNLSQSPSSGGKLEATINSERLRKWVDYLQRRGSERTSGRVVPDKVAWHVIWYDSVIYPHGRVAYQNSLSPANAPYFGVASGIFTNYSWTSPKISLARQRALLELSRTTSAALFRSPSDVYMGIDVFARGSVGGIDTPKALELIAPASQSSSLSTALFAPGWTWEHEDRRWPDWWDVDLSFWARIQEYHQKPLTYDAYATNFCKGSGSAWYVRGERVYAGEWTDMSVCAPKSLAWPIPHAFSARTHEPTDVATHLAEDTVWSGNSALRISTTDGGGIIVPLARVNAQQDMSVTLVVSGSVSLGYFQDPKTVTLVEAPHVSVHGIWTCMSTKLGALGDMCVCACLHSGTHDATVGYVQVSSNDADEHEATWEPANQLSWPDFAPWTNAYELFAVGDKTTWLGTLPARTSATVMPPGSTPVLEVRPVGSSHGVFVALS